MESLSLKVTTREVLGKQTRFLRRQGVIPAHLFGHDLESLTLQCNTTELQPVIARAGTTTLINLTVNKEKKPRKVLIREIQRDTFGRTILHVDFYQVNESEKIRASVPIVFKGDSPALKAKGRFLIHPLTILEIECLPDKLPHEIAVDLSGLAEVDQRIHVRDVNLGEGIIVMSDPDQLVVKVGEEAKATAEETAAEAAKEAAPETAEAKPEESEEKK
jgi:large subunit ribosomal protein L25